MPSSNPAAALQRGTLEERAMSSQKTLVIRNGTLIDGSGKAADGRVVNLEPHDEMLTFQQEAE
jgi:hypothetical protein